jgi:hypothetical protein
LGNYQISQAKLLSYRKKTKTYSDKSEDLFG